MALALLHTQPIIACTGIQVYPVNPSTSSEITITCKTDVEVKKIAVEIIGDNWNASFPNLFDDGSHGDQTKEDKTYSLMMKAPSVRGEYKIKFYRILHDQNELESTIMFSVQ
ncbi:choice-of-anchor X domain-containing protein [Bathymodiolus platifrons methanotrophic gill symbiont]|uniref:choice-of-anchor X domain-containing protein n=1 Tax=Bathymodiolus platifrons methanotrophic gill symbiont TaxID=113268 RepID=UPI001C8D81A5|nr:choice-of-anchor X domain-containing protein [Bathymodiolus platifrons methanotrophic gill symbiont]